MSDEGKRKRKPWWRTRWAFWTLWLPGFVGALLIGCFWWLSWNEKKKWEATLAQLDAWGETVDYREFMPEEFPPDENVLEDEWFLKFIDEATLGDGIRAAYFGVQNSLTDIEMSYLQEHAWGASPKDGLTYFVPQNFEKERVLILSNEDAARELVDSLNQNKETVDRLKAVLAKAGWADQNFDRDDFEQSVSLDHKFSAMIGLARAFAEASSTRAVAGDLEGAVTSLESGVILLRHVRAHRFLIGQLVEITVEGVLSPAVWQILVSEPRDPRLLKRLDAIVSEFDQSGAGIIEALRSESAYSVGFMQLVQQNGADTMLDGMKIFGDVGVSERFAGKLMSTDLMAYRTMRVSVGLKIPVIREFESKLPRLPLVALGRELDAAISNQKAGQGKVGKVIETFATMGADGMSRFVDNQAMTLATTYIARTQIAAARFKLETGQYPTGFSELVPKYLSTVPLDPFDGELMRWTTDEGGKPLVYSVGLDLVDDGGAALDDDKQGDIRWLMSVQGINDPDGWLEE